MTKDGRPSRINDIRYFHGEMYRYLENHEEAVAFGRRLALFLNGEGFSVGAYPSLYIFLTSSLKPGAIEVTDQGVEWWHRFTYVGVPPNFPNVLDASELVKSGTIIALKTLRPDLARVIESAAQTVRAHGDDLRFLLKTHQTKRFTAEISFNVGIWPKPSFVFTSITDLSSSEFLDGPPIPVSFYADAFDYNGPIRLSDIERERSEFVPRPRPAMSKLVKRRG